MRRSTAIYICGVSVCAGILGGVLYIAEPRVPFTDLVAVSLLASLAILAELLAFLLPRATRGSLAFIAYLAMVVLVPNWLTIAAVLGVKTLTELRVRIPWYKVAFNVAQHVLGTSVAVLVYRALGGHSLLIGGPSTLWAATRADGGPALVAFALSYITNALLVSVVIALDCGASGVAVLRDLKLTTIGLDVLVGAPIFVFAWVYSTYGPLAAATLWMPFLAIRQTHTANLDLAQMNQELLELMVKSLEARDPYTSGHSRRVCDYSIIIARAIGCSPTEIAQIGRAALLHDVGKIHEKYAGILSKTERLSADEWLLMKSHPGDGAALVATMSKLSDIVPSIRHHHENWDGTGYPDALAGDAIPLAARIIRFADTIDAMTTQRPYRAALTESHVRHELIRCRGTQFDPRICDLLLGSALWYSLFGAAPLVETTPAYQGSKVDLRVVRGMKMHDRIA